MTISAVIKAGISAGKSNEEILVDVYKEFPNANTKTASISWYRSQMKVKAPKKAPLAEAAEEIGQATKDALNKIASMTGPPNPAPLEYSVKNVKNTEGMEGQGFILTLYRGNKAVAKVADYGDGGPTHFEWMDRADKVLIKTRDYMGKPHSYNGTYEESLLVKLCDALPKSKVGGFKDDEGKDIYVNTSPDIFVSDLLGKADRIKMFRRLTKTKLAYVTPKGIYTINRPYSVETAKQVLAKNPGATILNTLSEEEGLPSS